MILQGKKILEGNGGEEAYDAMIRDNFTPRFPKISMKEHRKIVFEK